MPALSSILFDLPTAASLAGVEEGRLRNWIDREGLFRSAFGGVEPGRGIPWSLDMRHVFMIAAVRALVEDVGFPATRAVAAIAPYSVIPYFYRGEHFLVPTSGRRRAEVHILMDELWAEMRERWAGLYSSDVEAFEASVYEKRLEVASGEVRQFGDWNEAKIHDLYARRAEQARKGGDDAER